MDMDNKCVVLNSSSCKNLFPTNNPANFRVKFAKPLTFDDPSKWTVGLKTLRLPRHPYILRKPSSIGFLTLKNGEPIRANTSRVWKHFTFSNQVIDNNEYEDVKDFIETINESIKNSEGLLGDVITMPIVKYNPVDQFVTIIRGSKKDGSIIYPFFEDDVMSILGLHDAYQLYMIGANYIEDNGYLVPEEKQKSYTLPRPRSKREASPEPPHFRGHLHEVELVPITAPIATEAPPKPKPKPPPPKMVKILKILPGSTFPGDKMPLADKALRKYERRESVERFGDIQSAEPCDIHYFHKHFYIISDIVQRSRVDDKLVNLLDFIVNENVNISSYAVCKQNNKPHMHPVSQSHIETIEIKILDSQFQSADLRFGETSCTLIFKRID